MAAQADVLPTQDAENRPDYESQAYGRMKEGLKITQNLWGGTLDIRNEGYLKPMPMEEPAAFKERVDDSVFYNEFQRTVESGVGLIFKSDPTPVVKGDSNSIFNQMLVTMFKDIDLSGNDLPAFLRETATHSWRDGHSFIYVDAPNIPQNEDGSPVIQNQIQDFRPHWINFTAAQCKSLRYISDKGKVTYTQMVFEYEFQKPKGTFGEITVCRYLVLEIGQYSVQEKVVDAKGVVTFTNIEGPVETGLTFIPVTIVYSRKIGIGESRPPLLELANLNILHYRKTSDFDNWCHICCVPILTRRLMSSADAEKSGVIPIGPTIMVNVIGEHSDLKYTEVEGHGLAVVQTRIKEIEHQMGRLGVEMMSPTYAVEKTATEVISEEGESQSQLAVSAKGLETSFEEALYFSSQYINIVKNIKIPDQDLGAIQLNIDYNKLTFNVNQMNFFMQMVERGWMSIDTFLAWLPKVTEMPKEFNATTEIEKIKKEADLRKLLAEITGTPAPTAPPAPKTPPIKTPTATK